MCRTNNGTAVEATLDPTIPWGSVSTTLEYAADDFATAQFAARALCDSPGYRHMMRRSANWQNVYDPAAGVMAARSAGGPFTLGASPTNTEDFVEGDAAQYTWAVPFDLARLFERLGGTTAARRKLDAFLANLNAGPASRTAFLGNEPTLETPWEYDWLESPTGPKPSCAARC